MRLVSRLCLLAIWLISSGGLLAQDDYYDHPISQKQLIFSDDFDDNRNGWEIASDDQANQGISKGIYTMWTKSGAMASSYLPFEIDENRDFEIEFRMRIANSKNEGEISRFHWGKSNTKYIFLALSMTREGKIKIARYRGSKNGSWEDYYGWVVSRPMKKTDFNVFTIRKVGSYYYFFVNQTFEHKMYYEGFYGPSMGFHAGKYSTVEVDFLRAYYLDGLGPTSKVNDPPSLVITSPVPDRGFKSVQSKTVRVEGFTSDSDGIYEVKVNNVDANLTSDGSFYSDVLLKLGSNPIKIVATDIKGLSSTATITVSREAMAANSNNTLTSTQKRMALIIGNSQYSNGGSLKNPVNDARSMETALRTLGFEVIKVENASQGSMKRAIDEFGRKLSGYDVGLFFYAGHGVQVKGSNYLIPSDASISTENDVEYNCVRADRVLAKMEDAGSKTNIVVLDACRNNPFERSWNRSANGNGLAFMNAPSGSLVAYATAPGSVASDGSGANGLYTEALLQHIRTPNLTIEEVFKRVRATVSERSGGDQTPWESTSLTGNFYFK